MHEQPNVPQSVVDFLYRLAFEAKCDPEINVAAGILLQDLGVEPSE